VAGLVAARGAGPGAAPLPGRGDPDRPHDRGRPRRPRQGLRVRLGPALRMGARERLRGRAARRAGTRAARRAAHRARLVPADARSGRRARGGARTHSDQVDAGARRGRAADLVDPAGVRAGHRRGAGPAGPRERLPPGTGGMDPAPARHRRRGEHRRGSRLLLRDRRPRPEGRLSANPGDLRRGLPRARRRRRRRRVRDRARHGRRARAGLLRADAQDAARVAGGDGTPPPARRPRPGGSGRCAAASSAPRPSAM
jgi:hypothetical protein